MNVTVDHRLMYDVIRFKTFLCFLILPSSTPLQMRLQQEASKKISELAEQAHAEAVRYSKSCLKIDANMSNE